MATVGMRAGWTIGLVVLAALTGAGLWWVYLRYASGPLEAARSAYDRGDWNEAFVRARQRLRAVPNDRSALKLLGRSAARVGQHEMAQAVYSRLGPESMECEDFFLLGTWLLRQGQAEAGWNVLERVRPAELSHPESLHELARLYSQADRLTDATETATRLAAMPGWSARAQLILGLLWSEQEDSARAATALGVALERDPSLRGAALSPHTTRKLLARALLETRRPAEARDLLQIVLDQGPDPEASWLLSRALLQDGAIAEAMQSLRLAENSGQPQGPEPAPYVGAASCAECHAAIYRSQQESRHARTFRPAAQLQFLSLPDRPMADPVDSRVLHTFQRHGESIRVETRAGEHTFRAVIESAIGSGEPALTPLARDADGRAYELRLTLYAAGPAWDKSAGQPDNPEAPEGFLGRFLNHDAVRRCLECHTTSSYVAQEQLETPAKRDHGVSCERCHGPGGHHLLAVAADFPDLAISRPQVDQAESLVTMCGRCHSPKGSPISSEDPAHIRFQASTLIHSLCYTRSGGAFQCVTCHNPHADAERSPSFYEAKCLACHGVATAGPAEQSKRVPCPVNPATNCLPCHMPVATNVLPHTSFTDHHIRVRPDTDSD